MMKYYRSNTCGPQKIRPAPQFGQIRNPHTEPISATVSFFGFQGHFLLTFLWPVKKVRRLRDETRDLDLGCNGFDQTVFGQPFSLTLIAFGGDKRGGHYQTI
ncbi:MAG: hypothetical protein J7K75_01975 [Desulfuromonas sp.]|nr:hypothetical protein [Desulfuromonas sp.]